MIRDKSFHNKDLSNSEKQILRLLLYYDVFEHPLNREEISDLFRENDSKRMNKILLNLEASGYIEIIDDYICLDGNKQNISNRLNEATKIYRFKKIAVRMTKIIASFPFVRGVLISGSLSKERIGNDADIDFFIITKSNRLYISRTLLTLFKKIFLLNSYKYFCINYFVGEDELEIREQNLYAATELVTLIPVFNYQLCHQLFEKNSWIKEYYPGFVAKPMLSKAIKGKNVLKHFVEFVFKGSLGNYLDDWFWKLTLRYRERKFKGNMKDTYGEAFCTDKNCSRHHPLNFQGQILKDYEAKLMQFEQKYQVSIRS